MKKIICFLFLILPIFSFAQEKHFSKVFSKVLEVVHEKGGKGSFKGQILKGKRNGMGVSVLKRGALYVGDFYRGDVSGYGMYIAAENGSVEYCDNCVVYIGNWRDGKKSGIGTCYAANGDVVYQGNFENDKPVGRYPSDDVNLLKYFSRFEMEDGSVFLGEMNNRDINGYGVIVFSNGDLWVSDFKNGQRNGVGLYLLHDGEWEMLNFQGKEYDVLSSSVNYRNMDAARKEESRQMWATFLGAFAEATASAVQLSNEIKGIYSSGNFSSDGGEDYMSNHVALDNHSYSNRAGAKKSDKNYTTTKIPTCDNNWMSDRRVYDRYDTEIVKWVTGRREIMEAEMKRKGSDFYKDKPEYKHIVECQEKMKQLREKWTARGCLITKSPREDDPTR